VLHRAIHRHDEGSHEGAGRKQIPPTGKSFEVDFCTVARWENGEIVEENLFYDVVGLMGQLGVGGCFVPESE
jgi:ketosteroid isomerase-like protein